MACWFWVVTTWNAAELGIALPKCWGAIAEGWIAHASTDVRVKPLSRFSTWQNKERGSDPRRILQLHFVHFHSILTCRLTPQSRFYWESCCGSKLPVNLWAQMVLAMRGILALCLCGHTLPAGKGGRRETLAEQSLSNIQTWRLQ